ncbi:hypothetical protein ACWEX2_13945 [Staphylococcus xylosus]|nr:hypothetical protein [Staphylococcus xylosus]MDW4404526.1 hypothetical protein [Staphylococcus saprophyticus]
MNRIQKKEEEKQKRITKYNLVLLELNIILAILNIVKRLFDLFFK